MEWTWSEFTQSPTDTELRALQEELDKLELRGHVQALVGAVILCRDNK